jgi:PGF-CTERM protein
MVGENEDALVAQQKNQAGGVGGYYDPQAGEIKIVSENLTTPQMDEITLSQELFHALQDQKFDITDYNQTTQELHNARDGIIEGDGNYVDRLYQQECNEGVWNGTCVMPQDDSPPAGLDLHVGLYQILFQPYSSGPAFVQEIQQSQGWEGVNEVYENPPASTEQTIHTDKYGVDEPTAVSVEDTSQDPWRPQELQDSSTSGNESVSFAQFGEAGLFVALWYPGYETRTATEIIPYRDHLNFTAAGELSQAEPYLYDHPATAGWEGEKLVTYVTDESGGTNETGYVYKLAWESEADATEFRNKWLELMEFRGAQAVEDHQETYRIPDEEPFGDAFYVTQDGDTVTIVNAPTIEDLSLINEGSAPEAQDSGPGTVTATETPTEAGTVTATDSGTETPADSGTETPTEETASANGPGFTVIVALVALGIAALAAKRSG